MANEHRRLTDFMNNVHVVTKTTTTITTKMNRCYESIQEAMAHLEGEQRTQLENQPYRPDQPYRPSKACAVEALS